MKIKFEVCNSSHVEELVEFIDHHWKKEHIFTKNRSLLDWQHKNGDNYNFILARQGTEIIGILGYIPTSQFSEKLSEFKQAWLAIWKVRDDISSPGLGLMMLKFLKKELNLSLICSLGLSQQVIPIYKALRYTVGQLNHYAFFHQKKNQFSVVSPPANYLVELSRDTLSFEKISEKENLAGLDYLFQSQPRKDIDYIESRYINHPSYDYKIILFKRKSKVVSLVVYRIICVKGMTVARIVDMQGESIMTTEFNYVVNELLCINNFDYIDIVTNIKSGNGSGFKSNTIDEFVVPNYFEPFELRNVTIDYAYNSDDNVHIFRGDSDQDRPNL